ncbi:MAG: AMP-dependent synthetase/ligase [Xanthobacteraceae bacterium]|nr:AMP-dependent synthetase/ligase [Xanthobacteraceae bacterium]
MNTHPQQAALESNAIATSDAVTLWGLFCARVRRTPSAIAYRDFDPVAGHWRDHSWQAIFDRVEQLRAALSRESLNPGDRVAILLPNGVDWACTDIAAHGMGLVVVGLYPHETADSNAYILGHADARLAILDSTARWASLGPLRSEFPLLEQVWIKDCENGPATEASGPVVRPFADVLAGTAAPPAPPAVDADDVATLIYTSGTTGRPKGVMLSHFAVLWNAQATCRAVSIRSDDTFLSILPLAHVFERTAGYYLPMMVGCTVAYARSPQDLADDLRAVRPTAMLGVPLVFERLCATIRAKAAGPAARRLLQLAIDLGWQGFLAAQRRGRPGPGARLLWPLLRRLVAAPVLAAFGGRLRVVFSGGAPLEVGVARMLIGLGLPVVEGYGLTEAAPVVAANRPGDNLPGSVGRPLDGVDVKLGPQGELLVHSPSTMAGYWKDAERTGKAIDAAGWLATGDLAEIGPDGHVFIRGRLTEMIVLSIGEKVNPNVVEAKITRDPLFAQAIVVGNRRPHLVAIVVLDTAIWTHVAAVRGLDPRRPNQAASKADLLARMTAQLTGLPRFAQVRAVHLTLDPWTLKAGLLTPTLKIKRERVALLYAKEIAELYADQGA